MFWGLETACSRNRGTAETAFPPPLLQRVNFDNGDMPVAVTLKMRNPFPCVGARRTVSRFAPGPAIDIRSEMSGSAWLRFTMH